MDADVLFMLARWLTCGIWIGAGVYKAFHWEQTVDEMTGNGIPFARLLLGPVIAMELVGSLLLITNHYVWAVSLVWIAFVVVATPFYHALRMYTPGGQFVFPQMVQTTKNVSIVGGLIALMLLDPDKPKWLVEMLARA